MYSRRPKSRYKEHLTSKALRTSEPVEDPSPPPESSNSDPPIAAGKNCGHMVFTQSQDISPIVKKDVEKNDEPSSLFYYAQ